MRGPFPPENNIIPVVTHDNTSGAAGQIHRKTNRACRESARCEELQITRAYDPIHRSQSSEYEQELKGNDPSGVIREAAEKGP